MTLDVSEWTVKSAEDHEGILHVVLDTPGGERLLVSRATPEEIRKVAAQMSPTGRFLAAAMLEGLAGLGEREGRRRPRRGEK